MTRRKPKLSDHPTPIFDAVCDHVRIRPELPKELRMLHDDDLLLPSLHLLEPLP